MRGAVLYGPRDLRFQEREEPKIIEPTDAVIRIPPTCVCGSAPWPYRGLQPIDDPRSLGHECGFVEEVGSAVKSVRSRAIRDRLVRHVGQHLSSLPLWLPIVVHASRVHVEGAGAVTASAVGGRDVGRDARRAV